VLGLGLGLGLELELELELRLVDGEVKVGVGAVPLDGGRLEESAPVELLPPGRVVAEVVGWTEEGGGEVETDGEVVVELGGNEVDTVGLVVVIGKGIPLGRGENVWGNVRVIEVSVVP